MDLKIDIRILTASLMLHLAAYFLLSLVQQNDNDSREGTIEVVIQNIKYPKTHIPDSVLQKEDEHDLTKPADFLSNKTQRVQRETIAENLGATQNKSAQNKSSQKTSDSVSANLLPIPTQTTSDESRQSSVNFEAPYVSKGEMTFLNSDFSTYASFYNRITPKIMYDWGSHVEDIVLFPHMRETLRRKLAWTTRVELILSRAGHFKDVIIVNSSGSQEMDHAVTNALKNSAPYLNPPTGMIEKDGFVHIHGQFTVYTQRPRLAH